MTTQFLMELNMFQLSRSHNHNGNHSVENKYIQFLILISTWVN